MTFIRIALTFLLLAAASSAQGPNRPEPRPAASNQGRYPGLLSTEYSFTELNDMVQRESQQTNSYNAYLEQQRLRAAAERAEAQRRDRERRELALNGAAPQSRANPDAPDQSELLKNSHDRDFILRNFHTMYVDAHGAQYFDSQQMKAALGKNKDFARLNINIVDDVRVADTVLSVSYTFAWDYPFALRHQNTTIVLVSGKGEGPFSGPLGAADVARQFVKTVKEWRVVKEKPGH